MEKNELLELEKRRQIYNNILKHPGFHIRELSRELNMPVSTLIYHLKYLKKLGFIEENLYKKYTRYYALRKIDRTHKKLLNLFREEATKKVLIYLTLNQFSSVDEISENLHKSRSTVSHHLKKLRNAGILECYKINGEKKYVLFEGNGRLLDVVLTYGDSFDEETRRIIIKILNGLNKNDFLDVLLDIIRDIFPHPYRV
jgi:predicted transcriptional regulator